MSKLEKAWISYDLGNSAFATTVLAAFCRKLCRQNKGQAVSLLLVGLGKKNHFLL